MQLKPCLERHKYFSVHILEEGSENLLFWLTSQYIKRNMKTRRNLKDKMAKIKVKTENMLTKAKSCFFKNNKIDKPHHRTEPEKKRNYQEWERECDHKYFRNLQRNKIS